MNDQDYDKWKLHNGEEQFRCARCEYKFDESNAVCINDESHCEDCAEKHFQKCEECHEYRADKDFSFNHDSGHCDYCIEKRME